MASKFPPQQIVPGIISQPKADLILKSYGLNFVKSKIYGDIQQEETDPHDAVSRLGTLVFDNVILLAPTYLEKIPKEEQGLTTIKTQIKVLSGNVFVDENGTQISSEEITGNAGGAFNAFKIDTCLVEISQTRNVVVTPIAGARGTIKEYIGDGDYEIKLRGFIESDSPYKYPAVDVGVLSSYLKAPVPITILSNYLRNFEIKNIVVQSYNFPQTEGRRNLQFFEINAVSDLEDEKQFIELA